MEKTNPNIRVFQLDNKNNNKLKPFNVRVAQACTNCRIKKNKCSGTQTCDYCSAFSLECIYTPRVKRQKTVKLGDRSLQESTTGLSKRANFGAKNDAKYKHVLEQLFPNFTFPSEDDNINEKQLIEGLISSSNKHSNFKDDVLFHLKNKKILIELPPKEQALELVTKTWNFACLLFRFYHRPTFLKILMSLYDSSSEEYTDEQYKTLPLIYSVFACACLFSKDNEASLQKQGFYEEEGYRYFLAASSMLDMANVADITSIQAIYMLTLFLQNSGKLTTAYTYIGTALRSVVRKGLHKKRSFDSNDENKNKNSTIEAEHNPLEIEIEKRLFWTIYKTEIHMNCMLGLPTSLHEKDVSQSFPIDIDDSNLFHDRIALQNDGKVSSCGMNNEHTKLILILNHVKENFYTLRNENEPLSLECVKIMEMEIQKWLAELPDDLRPRDSDGQGNLNTTHDCHQLIPEEYLKANKLLHLDYLHVVIYLYRPFLSYVLHPTFIEQNIVVQKCIAACREVVHVSNFMIRHNLIDGSYWFSQHTIFFAIACLMYLKNLQHDDINIAKDRNVGLEILYKLKKSSKSSAHIFNELAKTFDIVDLDALIIENNPGIKIDAINSLQFSQPTPASNNDVQKSAPVEDTNTHANAGADAFNNFFPDIEELGLDYLYFKGIENAWQI